MSFAEIGLKVPSILFPAPEVDLRRWAVVACDQYTSQPEYWQAVADDVGQSPSTLNLVFPEVYLEEPDGDDRVQAINRTMQQYLDQGILRDLGEGFILLDRSTSHAPSRRGLMVALDLEAYDFREGSGTLIRATEGTIVDRLPPRIRIRKDAPIEVPHIMVLIDDPERTVIDPLATDPGEPLCDFPLMQNSGHLRAWQVKDPEKIAGVGRALTALADPEGFAARYKVGPEHGVLLYAMGDGNHSLATAKAIWEDLKGREGAGAMDHPARFALVELVNVHDAGIVFEPIHRVVFNTDGPQLLQDLVGHFTAGGMEAACHSCDDRAAADRLLAEKQGSGGHHMLWFSGADCGVLSVQNPRLTLETGTLQSALDACLEGKEGNSVDYIHGEDVVLSLSKEPGRLGFLLPVLSKNDLFRTVILDGALPRKTFSMGEADEKRFYLECRRIVPG